MIGARSNATAEYIYLDDPALDKESKYFDFKRYMQTLDRKHLPVKAGQTATVFKIRRLPRVTFTALASLAHTAERAVQAVAYGVIGVENFMNGNGQPIVLEFVGEGVERRLTGDSLNAIFAPQLFGELMTVITTFSDLDPLADGRSGSSPG